MQKYTYLDGSWDSIESYWLLRGDVVMKDNTDTWESQIKALGVHLKFNTPKPGP